MNYYTDVLRKYAVFSGRARRKEYWMFLLFNTLIIVGIALIEAIIRTNGVLGGIYSLAIIIPGLAVSIRRLHDTNHSGWWLLVNLIPLIGFIVLLVFLVSDSQAGENQYGPNPKETGNEVTTNSV